MTRRAGIFLLPILVLAAPVVGQETATRPFEPGKMIPDLSNRGTGSAVLQWLGLVTVVSIVPAIAVLVTSFTRIIVVLGLLRQGLGTGQLPPNTVLFGLSLLVSLVVMAPVFDRVYRDAIGPYAAGAMDQTRALRAGETHVREFMIHQIQGAGNHQDVHLFLDDQLAAKKDLVWRDVPSRALIPAFVISELKVAFLIGFRIFLPFLVIDMLVASILTSMGMLMLPPVLISLPFKLLLFVLADGWHLVTETLMKSFS